jgi:hypothetical protein
MKFGAPLALYSHMYIALTVKVSRIEVVDGGVKIAKVGGSLRRLVS